MALRVPKAEIPTELGEGMIKQFGAVPEPVEVMLHNPKLATLTAAQWSDVEVEPSSAQPRSVPKAKTAVLSCVS